jgi:hypothetical protein
LRAREGLCTVVMWEGLRQGAATGWTPRTLGGPGAKAKLGHRQPAAELRDTPFTLKVSARLVHPQACAGWLGARGVRALSGGFQGDGSRRVVGYPRRAGENRRRARLAIATPRARQRSLPFGAMRLPRAGRHLVVAGSVPSRPKKADHARRGTAKGVRPHTRRREPGWFTDFASGVGLAVG